MPVFMNPTAGEAAHTELEYEANIARLEKEDAFHVVFLEVLGILFLVIAFVLLLLNSLMYFPQILFFDIAGITMVLLAEHRRKKDNIIIKEDHRIRELHRKIRNAERDYQL